MSLWTGIKAIFGATPDKAMDAAKGVGNFIDESFYTEQEKSVANQKLLDWKLKWINATQGQNLARRYCAMIFGANFIITFQVCVWSLLDGYRSHDPQALAASKAFVTDVIALAVAFDIGLIMMMIIAFYFGKELIGWTSKGKKSD